VFSSLFQPSENSLLAVRAQIMGGRHGGAWTAWLMLVWSLWVFLTPAMTTPGVFPNWLWPTVIAYVVFLWLFYRAYYRDRRQIVWCALGIAGLGYALTPLNGGAQGFLVYACAFLAFCMPPRRAILAMVAVLALHAVQWQWLRFPWPYILNGVVVGLAVGLMNISYARKMHADAALKLSHDEVRRLAALAERERIGRDLHDLLGHTLSLVALKSELAGRLVQRDPMAARAEIDQVARVAREALAQVRAAVTGIRAAGIAAELASAKLLLESDGVAFKYAMAEAALPPRVETALAMTVREAVTNIQRHACASNAEVAFETERGDAIVRISDDGRGGAIVPGNGLGGMRERIEALGGRLRIDSTAGLGTRIEARLPLAANDDVDVAPEA
jgi:two-component system sensor histidine kinase DesK